MKWNEWHIQIKSNLTWIAQKTHDFLASNSFTTEMRTTSGQVKCLLLVVGLQTTQTICIECEICAMSVCVCAILYQKNFEIGEKWLLSKTRVFCAHGKQKRKSQENRSNKKANWIKRRRILVKFVIQFSYGIDFFRVCAELDGTRIL